MHSYNNAYTYKLFKLLKESKLNFIACPTENIHLQGRFDTYPKRRGVTRVKEMVEEGINVCFAQDSMSDPWYPLGSGNLINTSKEMFIHRNTLIYRLNKIKTMIKGSLENPIFKNELMNAIMIYDYLQCEEII